MERVTPDMAAPYHDGDVVHLTAMADSGWVFSWLEWGCEWHGQPAER